MRLRMLKSKPQFLSLKESFSLKERFFSLLYLKLFHTLIMIHSYLHLDIRDKQDTKSMLEKIFLVQETMDSQNSMIEDQVFRDTVLEILFLNTLGQKFEVSILWRKFFNVKISIIKDKYHKSIAKRNRVKLE